MQVVNLKVSIMSFHDGFLYVYPAILLYSGLFLQPLDSPGVLGVWLRQTAVERQWEVWFLEGSWRQDLQYNGPSQPLTPPCCTRAESRNRPCTRCWL